jgi:phosphoglycolate phosphatase
MPTTLRFDGRPLEAVLFDWDGTLADSHGSLFAANAAVMRAFRLPFDEDLYRRHYAADWRVMYERLGLREDQIHEANQLWEAAYDGIETTDLFPGAAEAIERLNRLGIPLGLVTAGPSPIVGPQVARLGLSSLLPIRVYGDDLFEQKPDPAPLRLALERLGFDGHPSTVAYIGDAPDDMRMARAIGVHGIGVPSRLSDREQLLEAGAEDVVGSVAEWVSRALLETGAGR